MLEEKKKERGKREQETRQGGFCRWFLGSSAELAELWVEVEVVGSHELYFRTYARPDCSFRFIQSLCSGI
jgi:hypothetical protein